VRRQRSNDNTPLTNPASRLSPHSCPSFSIFISHALRHPSFVPRLTINDEPSSLALPTYNVQRAIRKVVFMASWPTTHHPPSTSSPLIHPESESDRSSSRRPCCTILAVVGFIMSEPQREGESAFHPISLYLPTFLAFIRHGIFHHTHSH